jgi:hypothetical protein
VFCSPTPDRKTRALGRKPVNVMNNIILPADQVLTGVDAL